MGLQYDNRINRARGNTGFALDALWAPRHLCDMDSQAQILAALRDKGVTQKQIAGVLKVSQPNAATLYTPAKNGKLRKLSYDEGLALIREFNLELPESVPTPVSAETLEPVLDALLPLAPPGPASAQSRRALAEALAYGLGLLGIQSATMTSDDAYAVAARAAVARFREIGLA